VSNLRFISFGRTGRGLAWGKHERVDRLPASALRALLLPSHHEPKDCGSARAHPVSSASGAHGGQHAPSKRRLL
jgi:hypothetical protein